MTKGKKKVTYKEYVERYITKPTTDVTFKPKEVYETVLEEIAEGRTEVVPEEMDGKREPGPRESAIVSGLGK